MKKLTFLVLFICITFAGSGQTFLSEDFSGGVMPPAGWSIENQLSHWSIKPTNISGGTAPEARFNYADTVSVTRLISPPIDLTGLTTVTLMFNHMYDWYENPAPAYGIATRSGGGNWTSVYEIQPTGNVGPETIVVNINNPDVGHSDFQFCLYLNGNLNNLDFWYSDDILLYAPSTLDAALTQLQLPSYMVVNDSQNISGTVKNMGAEIITSFEIAYTVNGGPAVIYPETGLNLALGDTYDFTDSIPLVFEDPGTYHVVVNVQNVNNSIDNNPVNDTLDGYIAVVPWFPSRKVFAEEATGTWCGWCVRGICNMDYMQETYPDTWIGVSIHNNDPMVYAPWDEAIPNIIPGFTGFPSGIIDRTGNVPLDPLDFESEYLKRIQDISPATVGIVNFHWEPETRNVSFDVESEFVLDVTDELRFAAVIVEDSVWGTDSGYDQQNEYSGGGNGVMCGFENLPSTVPAAQMHYDYVGRVILDTPYGTPGSIPTPALAGQTYSHSYTYTIPTDWEWNKLRFVGLLINNTTGAILNANDQVIWMGSGEMNGEISMNIYPNPFIEKTNVAFTIDQPSKISLCITDLLGRQVTSLAPKNYAAGPHVISIDGSSFANGCYLVRLTVGDKVYTHKIFMAK